MSQFPQNNDYIELIYLTVAITTAMKYNKNK